MINNKSSIAPPPDAMQVANCNKSRRVAFTLAEVLITIGIIGGVAAITIPTLIAKYQLKEGAVALKKAISVLNQAAAKTVVDFGSVPECYSWLNRPYPPMETCLNRDE